MNKNNIVDLLQKELGEMTTIAQTMMESEKIPSVLFQLSHSKVENIKNLLALLQSDDEPAQAASLPVEEPVAQPVEEPVAVATPTVEPVKEEAQQQDAPSAVEQPHPVVQEGKRSFSDTFGDKKSLNERMSENGKNRFENAIANKKIENLRQAINVVDRFRYQKELFGGNQSAMNDALDRINDAPSWDSALEIIGSFSWDVSLPVVKEFTDLVKRKFN